VFVGLLGGAAFLYIAIAVTLFAAQRSIFFPARLVRQAGPLPPGAERLAVVAPDGVRLEGVHLPPPGVRSGLLILGFAGNASNAQDVAVFLRDLYPAHDVIGFHYRGYRPSGGVAGAAALAADAPRLYDFAVRRLAPERTVAVGISLGSGVAAALAAARPLDGLILVTPFDSLKAVARQHYPWLPTGLLVRHDLPSAGWLRKREVPVAIVAAANDSLILPERTDALRRSVPRLVFDRTIAHADHNSIAAHPEFVGTMRAALAAVVPPHRPGVVRVHGRRTEL